MRNRDQHPTVNAIRRAAALPELNVLGFALLLHFPLELWMMGPRLISDPHAVARAEVAAVCTAGAVGHAVITLFAFWFVAAARGSRSWLRRPTRVDIVVFVIAAGLLTVAVEAMAPVLMLRWAHIQTISTFARPGTFVPSLLQAFAVPLLLLFVARRQVIGA